MAKSDITSDELRAHLTYDPKTGTFTSRTSGRSIGFLRSVGYRYICIKTVDWLAHRLAWLYVHGSWPTGHIDHVDGDKLNNRIDNLRDVSHATNMHNIKGPRKTNKCGYLGVTFRHGIKPWRATICVDRKYRLIGRYETPELAHSAYLEAKRRLHDGCTI